MANVESQGNKKSLAERGGDWLASKVLDSGLFNSYMKTKKINDVKEFSMLDNLQKAKCEVPAVTDEYIKLYNVLGLPYNTTYFNLWGLYTGTLPFYNKFVKSNGLPMILDGKANKVIDATTGYENRATDEQDITKEQFRRRALFKDLQRKKDLYGRAFMNIKNVGVIPQELNFDVIEPFNCFFVGEEESRQLYIITPLGYDSETTNKKFRFNIIHRFIQGETYREEQYNCHVAKKKDKYELVIEENSTEEKIIDGFMCYEIVDDTLGESNIKELDHELLMYDITETMLSLEVHGTKLTVHADKRYFEFGELIRSDMYTIYDAIEDGDKNGNKPLFHVEQPTIRIPSYKDVKGHYMSVMSSQIGISLTALGIVEVEDRTATVALLKEDKTTETINDAKSDFKEQLTDVLDELYNGLYEFVLDEYQSQSQQFRAEIVSKFGGNVSTEQKTKMLFPEMDEQEALIEVILVKLERGALLTEEQRLKAIELGLFEGEDRGGA